MSRQWDGKRQVVREWWNALQPAETDPGASETRTGGAGRFFFDRGDRARLRRCNQLVDAVAQPAVWKLAEALGVEDRDSEAVLLTACVLAHVKDDVADSNSFVYALGNATTSKDERALLSELRFQRLMRAERPEELLQQVRRVLSLGAGAVDVGRLAEDLFAWMNERRYSGSQSNGVKYRWARDYYLKRSERAAMETQEG